MITIKSVESLPANSILWDEGKGACPGFGVRRQSGTACVYIAKYRFEGRQRWLRLGQHGALTPDQARALARKALAEVAAGVDPQAVREEKRDANTVDELIDAYLSAAEKGLVTYRGRAKKASTLETDRGRLERHVKPILGKVKVSSLARRDIERLKDAIASGATAATIKTGKHGLARVTGGKGTATRTLATFAGLLSWAVARGYLSSNPAKGVEAFKYEKRRRRASDEEYARLGAALRSSGESAWPPAIAAVRFAILTGWRKGEILSLRWRDVDILSRVAHLRDTKTGESVRPLSHAAIDVLDGLPCLWGEDGLVFPSAHGHKPMAGFPRFWEAQCRRAEVEGLTLHALRHSFSSVATDLGLSESTRAELLGHRRGSVTEGYSHFTDAVLLAAADRVANSIAERMGEAPNEAKIIALRR